MLTIASHRFATLVGAASLIMSAAAARFTPGVARHHAPAETVMITYRVKRGAESDLARVLADHWAAARRLQLVDSAPHIIVKTADAGQAADVIEIFTWRDASTPDNAPPEIQAAWAKMVPLVEARGGHPAIEPTEVSIVR